MTDEQKRELTAHWSGNQSMMYLAMVEQVEASIYLQEVDGQEAADVLQYISTLAVDGELVY